MGLIQRIFGVSSKFEQTEKRSHLTSWDLMQGRGIETAAGLPVTATLAENLSAVYACVQAISETIAALPAIVYRVAGDTREVAPGHPVSRLLYGQPNPLQSSVEFIEMMQAHCLLRGNAYARIVRDNRGAPTELWPLHPGHVSVLRIPGTMTVVYDVSNMDGGTTRYVASEMFHLRDRSDDGVVGRSRLARARDAFATAEAVERFAGTTFKNGARLSGVLTTPEGLSDPALLNIKNSFTANFSGSDKAGSVAVLEEGLKFQAISVSPQDAEILASRKFSVEQICRLFRVPPVIIADLTHATFSNVTELGRWFYQQSIVPWLTKWEAAVSLQLFSEAGRREFEIEFDTDLLLRANMLERFQSYRIGREVGLYSANELRQFESLNPRTDVGGDEYLAPLNMSSEQTALPKQ